MPIEARPSHPTRSWLDPRVEVRPSPIDRLGLFATAPIREGERIIVWGGRVITDDDIPALEAAFRETGAEYSCAAIGEGLNLLQQADDPLRYGNHSCDPNRWMLDATTEVARRDIAAGEELTIDYATSTVLSSWRMERRCGSPLCRVVIIGDDWRRPDLQARYRDHFSPFINARIHQTGQQ
jgi:SET domain-containing protein